jgi:hypothetical protein
MLHERFWRDPLVHSLDLGWAVDLHDATQAYDGMHLTPEGNQRIAHRLAEFLWSFLVDTN